MNKNDYCSLNTSYLLNIDESEKKRFQNNESSEKQKYINNTDSKTFSNGIIFPNEKEKKNTSVDVDSFLRYPPNLYQNKTSVELNKNLDHNKYDLLYSNRMQPDPIKKTTNNKKSNISIINDKPYIGAGRGIGDLDVSELIRTGQDTRRYNDKYREKQESHIIDRFQILDKNYQDPKHIVMNIPRGGVQTRKNKKLIDQTKKGNFNFNY